MRILLGVSGGIAAYKAVETARLAIRAGHSVRAIQTPVSERFLGRATLAGITGAPVLLDEFEPDPARGAFPGEPLPGHAPISHLALVERADVFLIAPASANTVAKLAHGLSDNLVCTAALAAACPVVVAPAMNERMYLSPATQANLGILRDRGFTVLEPGVGALASHGEQGIGRLPEPPELLAACERALPTGHSWRALSVLVTAGGTQEPIDSVRFIGNRSSGRMGYALAEGALARGASVTVVAANVKLDPPAGATIVQAGTAADLSEVCGELFPQADILLMAAAVADFRPSTSTDAKLKKEHGVPRLQLEPTEDVLATLSARRRTGQTLVGFAAEHGPRAAAEAREKLERKDLDLLVVNDISRPEIGFDVPDNEVTLIGRDGSERVIPQTTKRAVADEVLDEVERLRSVAEGGTNGAAGRTALSRSAR